MNKELIKNRLQYIIAQYYTVVVVLVVALILVLGVSLFIWPQYLAIKESGTYRYRTTKNELVMKQQTLSQLQKMALDYEKINLAELKALDLALPTEQDIPGLFIQMEALVADNGFVLNSIDFAQSAEAEATSTGETDKKTGQNLKEVTVALSISGGGGYDNLKTLLDSLENNIRILDIKSLNFSPESESYAINITTYYLE